MTDEKTEKIFSSIVNDYLSTRVPGLFKYVRAIYVLDADDDGSRVVGAVIYRVGDQWFVSPVFYLNGQLRGHDLLYVVANKVMVPANDKWISYLISRKPVELGDIDLRQPNELGIRVPNMASLANAAAKTASDGQIEKAAAIVVREYLPSTIEEIKEAADYFDLRTMLTRYGKPFQQRLFTTMYKNAAFAEAIKQFYDIQELIQIEPREKAAYRNKGVSAIDKLAVEEDQQDGSLQIIMSVEEAAEIPLKPGLSDEEKRKLIRNDIVIRDKRWDDQVSKAFDGDFDTAISEGIRSNPGPGVFQALTISGDTAPVVVLKDTASAPLATSENSKPEYTVVRLDTGALTTLSGDDIYVLQTQDVPDDSVPDDVKNVSELSNGAYKGKRIIVFDNQFNYLADGWVGAIRKDNNIMMVSLYWTKDEVLNPPDDIEPIHISVSSEIDKPIELKSTKWIVPENTKFVVTEPGVDCDLAPSTMVLKMAALNDQYYELKVTTSDGLEWVITENGHAGEPLTYKSALATLVAKHSLRENDARMIMKEAGDKSISRRFVKRAASPLMPASAAGYDSVLGMVADYPSEMAINEPELAARDAIIPSDENALSPLDQQRVINAGKTGQKDVLDLALLTSFVRRRDPIELVHEFLPDIVVAMDRVGKILFLLYWHGKAFSERYGKSDLAELEDTLRDVFSALGDLVLFLKRKTIKPIDSTEPTGMGLDELV